MLKVWLVISGPRFKHNPATYIHFRTNQFTLDTRPHPSLVGWKNEVTLMTAIQSTIPVSSDTPQSLIVITRHSVRDKGLRSCSSSQAKFTVQTELNMMYSSRQVSPRKSTQLSPWTLKPSEPSTNSLGSRHPRNYLYTGYSVGQGHS